MTTPPGHEPAIESTGDLPPWLQPPTPPPPGSSKVKFGPDEGTDWGPLTPADIPKEN